jgi:LacI family transcriptional regulator
MPVSRKPASRRPTQYDVARLAGVSQAAVSQVVNHPTSVSIAADTRQRILRAMEMIGYAPNTLARSLRMGQTLMLGLIFPDSANPFFAEVGRQMEETAFELGYSVILCNTGGSPEKERFYTESLARKQVDGIIFVAGGSQADCLHMLLEWGMPVVVVDRDLPECAVDAVLLDNYAGGMAVAAHLIDLGHRSFGCITGPSEVNPSAERVAGFKNALRAHALGIEPRWIKPGDFRLESGWRRAMELLAAPLRPTAIFACNDLMAVGVLRAAAELRLKVPGDLSVVGFDNIELASYTAPPLTTVAQPREEIGARAVNMLIDRIKEREREPRRELLKAVLIARGSSAPPEGGEKS